MKALRWLLVLPLVAALAAPAFAQDRTYPSGGGGRGGYGGGYRGGGLLPGLLFGVGAAAAAAAAAKARDRERPRRVYRRPPPPDIADSHEAPPPRRHRLHPRKNVEAVAEAPPPRRIVRPPPRIPAPARALLPAPTEKRLAPDEILVAFKTERPGQAQDFARAQKLDLVETRALKLIGVTVHRFRLPPGGDLRGALRRAGRDPRLAWAQPNYFYALQEPAAPTPAAAPEPEGYAGAALNLSEAHKLARGQGVAVAVIDSQVDADHPELAGMVADQFDATGGGAQAHAHGTAMAGAISGHVKLAGAAPGARLLAVRAFDPGAQGARGATLNIAAGLDWAADKGARVVNMSFAGPPDPLMEKMVFAAGARGMALIAAAGNEGPNAPPLYPGAYASVIAVAAVDEQARIYDRDNRGGYIKLAAPGVDVLAAAPNGGYDLSTGTSIACAEVSGIAALVLEKNPGLDVAGLRRILRDSARKLAGEGDLGAADAAAALRTGKAPAQ
jgi:subtilisin family serine protease